MINWSAVCVKHLCGMTVIGEGYVDRYLLEFERVNIDLAQENCGPITWGGTMY
jgi:hypothetical protein